LTLQSVRAEGLHVAGVVITPWPDAPTPMQRSNANTIAVLGDVEVATLAPLTGFSPAELARAGAALPYDRWLG
jgi:dethiobiotin synthetase